MKFGTVIHYDIVHVLNFTGLLNSKWLGGAILGANMLGKVLPHFYELKSEYVVPGQDTKTLKM